MFIACVTQSSFLLNNSGGSFASFSILGMGQDLEVATVIRSTVWCIVSSFKGTES